MNYLYVVIILAIILVLGYYTMKSEKNTEAEGRYKNFSNEQIMEIKRLERELGDNGGGNMVFLGNEGNLVLFPFSLFTRMIENYFVSKTEVARDYATKADIARYVENKNTIMDSIGPSIDFIRDNYVDKPAFKRFKDEELPITVRKSLESNPGLDTNYIRYSDTVDLGRSNDGIDMRFNFKKVNRPAYTNQ